MCLVYRLSVTSENIVVHNKHDNGQSLQHCGSVSLICATQHSYAELMHKQGIDRKREQERLCLITLHAMCIAQQDKPCKDHWISWKDRVNNNAFFPAQEYWKMTYQERWNGGRWLTGTAKSRKMIYRGLANSGLQQAGIGLAPVSHLPWFGCVGKSSC